MKHFRDMELEAYVHSNWLHIHGIPVNRKRTIIKYRKKYKREMLMMDEMFLFIIQKSVRYEKALFQGNKGLVEKMDITAQTILSQITHNARKRNVAVRVINVPSTCLQTSGISSDSTSKEILCPAPVKFSMFEIDRNYEMKRGEGKPLPRAVFKIHGDGKEEWLNSVREMGKYITDYGEYALFKIGCGETVEEDRNIADRLQDSIDKCSKPLFVDMIWSR